MKTKKSDPFDEKKETSGTSKAKFEEAICDARLTAQVAAKDVAALRPPPDPDPLPQVASGNPHRPRWTLGLVLAMLLIIITIFPKEGSCVEFTTISTTGDDIFKDYKYSGSAAVGTKVYFAPCGLYSSQIYSIDDPQKDVGVFDTALAESHPNAFYRISTGYINTKDVLGETVLIGRPYRGAAVVGTKIYFAPHFARNVGVVDTTTGTFSAVAEGLSDMGVTNQDAQHKFWGAVAVGTTVYFVPYKSVVFSNAKALHPLYSYGLDSHCLCSRM